MKPETKNETNMNAQEKIEVPAIEGKPQFEGYPYSLFTVGDKVNLRRYSDIQPGTVVDVKRNGCEVHVRVDNYKLAEGQKPNILPGGFAGHCDNQRDLVYDITENLTGNVEVFTLRNWRGRFCWTTKGQSPDGCQRVGQGWHAFYDYNF